MDMEKPNKVVLDYVMNDTVWKIDLPKFLQEIQECSKSTPHSASFKVLGYVLSMLVERAIELDDPVLHIIMLNLSLYDGSHDASCVKSIVKVLRDEIKEKLNN